MGFAREESFEIQARTPYAGVAGETSPRKAAALPTCDCLDRIQLGDLRFLGKPPRNMDGEGR